MTRTFGKFQRITIWLILAAFVCTAILLPYDGPSAMLAEIPALIAGLVFVFVFSIFVHRSLGSRYSFRLSPRSPPAF